MIVSLATIDGIKVNVRKPAQKAGNPRTASRDPNVDRDTAAYVAAHGSPDAPEFHRMLVSVLVSDMQPTEKLVYIGSLYEKKNFFMSNQRIANILKLGCAKTVARAFKSLEEAGCVETTPRRGQTAIRTFRPAAIDAKIAKAAEEVYARMKQKKNGAATGNPGHPCPPYPGHPCPPTSNIYTSVRESVEARAERNGQEGAQNPKIPDQTVTELAGAMQEQASSKPAAQPRSVSSLIQAVPALKPRKQPLGVAFYGERPVILDGLASEIHRRAGPNATRFREAWDTVKVNLAGRPADYIQQGVLKVADLLRDGATPSWAANVAFGEAAV